MKFIKKVSARTNSLLTIALFIAGTGSILAQNPIVRAVFTADPAAMVHDGRVYLYAGHDEAKGKEMFTMHEWLCFSSSDMKNWTAHGPIMRATDFKWAIKDAWASQVIEKNGKFYFYVTVNSGNPNCKAIGVAVSDSPTGPFTDARGSALVLDATTPGPNSWDDIDPTVFIDDDGTAWLSWGNPNCYFARLKPNMTEFDGPITRIDLPNYTEAPWLHKHGKLYYLTYASFAHQGMSEKICYATALSIKGPWTYRGILTENARNSYTIHPAIIEFNHQSYFFYHNAILNLDGQTGAIGRRCVCADYLYYNPDGTIQKITQTEVGLSVAPKSPADPIATSTMIRVKASNEASKGVNIVQDTKAKPTAWPGNPILTTVDNPFMKSVLAEGFSGAGGASSIGQSFLVEKNFKLSRISLYVGDGMATDEKNKLMLALYDLGTSKDSGSYEAVWNLLGAGKGIELRYDVQAPGLYEIVLSGKDKVKLSAGHRYVLELQGERNAVTLFWRKSNRDTFAGGMAYRNRKAGSERGNSSTDFALALYSER